MRKLRFSRRAAADLREIAGYIAEVSGSRAIAERFVERLRHRCRKLAARTGQTGRPRPEIAEDVRSVPEGNYIILFRYEGNTLIVFAVIEGHRDIRAMFTGENG